MMYGEIMLPLFDSFDEGGICRKNSWTMTTNILQSVKQRVNMNEAEGMNNNESKWMDEQVKMRGVHNLWRGSEVMK